MKRSVIKYKGKKYIIAVADLGEGSKGYIVTFKYGTKLLFINESLGKLERSKELHRLIKAKKMRNLSKEFWAYNSIQ